MLYLLQFACLIFMFISAFFIAVTRLHVRWINRRYEWSRWMIFAALLFMAVHFFLQMYFGFRATGEDVGAVINVLVYLPCFTLFSMAIGCIGYFGKSLLKRVFAFNYGLISVLWLTIGARLQQATVALQVEFDGCFLVSNL